MKLLESRFILPINVVELSCLLRRHVHIMAWGVRGGGEGECSSGGEVSGPNILLLWTYRSCERTVVSPVQIEGSDLSMSEIFCK